MSGDGAARTAILVAGMHRSGTSALTRVLTIAGCTLPGTLVQPKPDNVAGFWESQAVVDLNEEILAVAGSSWDDWRPFPRHWHASPEAGAFLRRGRELLRQEFGESRLFILKDPRICRLLPFWIEAVRGTGARSRVVVTVRSPLDVAASLEARNGIDPFIGYLSWLRHVVDAEAGSRDLPRVFTRYESLLAEPHASVDRIGRMLGLDWPNRSSAAARTDVEAFLSPELRHHRSDDAGLTADRHISEWVSTAFAIVERWTRDDVRAEDACELDRITLAFDDATPAFDRALAAGARAMQEARALSRNLEGARRWREETACALDIERRRHAATLRTLDTERRERAEMAMRRLGNSWDMRASGARAGQAADWPALDADLHEAPGAKPAGPKHICIATPDVLGPVKNGGIGTAYHHVARMLAAWGHDVVIAYVNANAADVELMAETRAFYARFGVDFEPLVPRADGVSPLFRVGAPTWTLLEWLRARPEPFDIVHVSEWRGLGYGPLLAKSLGLAFDYTHFVVKGSSPTLWSLEGNRQLVSAEAELGWVFMERRSVELADTVICGSAHLLGWMRDAGYTMPARAFVWPNVFPAPDPDPAAVEARAARDGASLDEVVFFGRLEPRKGLVLFADAIARLVRQQRAPARVTFLGKPAGNFDGLAFIRRATRHWPVDVQTRTDCGAAEAVAYLSRPGRLAVIPSLLENASIAVTECLQAGIPFVAAATGGTPELVAPEDHDHALAPPDHLALGDRIAALAAAPLRAVRPRRDFQLALDIWRRWHAQDAPFAADAERFAARARAADAERPTVTVCLVHHDRPALLRMAADSVLAQDYPALDAVLVDDGSESPEARAAVDEVETRFAPRGWRVIRQDNRYLGAARNAAVAAARGDWVLFLDDDNVLFPDAVSRLVRAAAFSGADCVPAASIRFTGDGDPREDTAAHGASVRFLGAARAWSRVCNVVGDACALVRRDAFEAVGGFTEVYGVGLEDLELFNRLIEAGKRIEPLPDPVYYYRAHPGTSMIGMLRDPYRNEACRARQLAPYIEHLAGEERAYAAYAATCTGQLEKRIVRQVSWVLARIWRRTSAHLRTRWTRWS